MTIVPDEKRQNFYRIFKQLGLKQRGVAAAIDMSPAAISKYLVVGSGHIGLRRKNEQKLLDVLKKRLDEFHKIRSATAEQLRVRGEEWDKSTVNAALSLSPDSITALETELASLLEPDIVLQLPDPVLFTPGGALPPHAVNYVKRATDYEIDAILEDGSSPASIVISPINGGTSSFLNRVYQQAQVVQDCWVGFVHLDAAFAEGEKFTQFDLFKYVFLRVGMPDDIFADDSLDVEGMKFAFDTWVRQEWKDASRIVLIIDGLNQVFENAGSIADPLALINWLTALRNETAVGHSPYNKLALFVALTGKTWSAAHASPYASQAGHLLLKKFTAKEVAMLFEQIGIEQNCYSAEEVHSLFFGHPYLTQLFAWSIRSGSTADEAKQAALALDGAYETHWERMKSEVQFLIGKNYELSEVLTVVFEVSNRQSYDPLNYNQSQIWQGYRRDLRVFGLLDGTVNTPNICEFYETAIKREKNAVAGESVVKRHSLRVPSDAN